MWHDLLVAFALMLVIEGILPFLNPDAMRKLLVLLAQFDDQRIRFAGLTSMVLGVVLLYVLKM